MLEYKLYQKQKHKNKYLWKTGLVDEELVSIQPFLYVYRLTVSMTTASSVSTSVTTAGAAQATLST